MSNLTNFRLISIFLLPLLLIACASTPPISINSDASIRIKQTTIDGIDTELDSNAEAVTRDVTLGAAGAVGGAAAGMVAGAGASLVCGPLFIFCAPVGVLAGAVVGGVGGGFAGATIGDEGVDGGKAELFNNLVIEELDLDNFYLSLQEKFVLEAGQYWTIDNASPNSLELFVSNFSFELLDEDVIQLYVSAQMLVETPSGSEVLEYEHTGRPFTIDT